MNEAKVSSAPAEREHLSPSPLEDPRIRESIDSGQPPPARSCSRAPLTPEHRAVWAYRAPPRWNVLGTALVCVALVSIVAGVVVFGPDLVWLLS